MNIKYRVLLLILIVIAIWKSFHYFALVPNDDELELSERSEHTKSKIKVSVYYEALCPDSKFFIAYRLLPTYEELADYIDIDFIPYGKAQTVESHGKITFFCQHDAVECFANKIHACVIDLVPNPLIQLKYISCMITDNMIPDDAGEKCGKEAGIKFDPISDCANGERGNQLLKEYGIRTHALNPTVNFIPTIELNGSQTMVHQSDILKDIHQVLCDMLQPKPNTCP